MTIRFTKEQIIRCHRKIVREMKRRGINHNVIDGLDKSLKHFTSPFYLKRPFAVAKGDNIQILFDERHPNRDTMMETHLTHNNPKVQFTYHESLDVPQGNLYDLVCIPSTIQLSDLNNWFSQQKLLNNLKDVTAQFEAHTSYRTNTITPMKFFLMCHPKKKRKKRKSKAAMAHIEKDYGGIDLVIMKQDDNVLIRTSEGVNVTDKLPTAKETFLLWPGTFTLLSNSSICGEGCIVEYLISDQSIDDKNIAHNIYDILFYDEDIHNLPLTSRRAVLDALPFSRSTIQHTPGVNRVPVFQLYNKKFGHAIVKNPQKPYRLDGGTDWYFMVPTSTIDVMVLSAENTDYSAGLMLPTGWKGKIQTIDDKTYMDIGMFKDQASHKVGDIVTLVTDKVFYYRIPSTHERQILLNEPEVVSKGQKLMSTEEVVIIAEKDKTLQKEVIDESEF